MRPDGRRLADAAAAGVMLAAGLALTFLVLPGQIPKGLAGDVSSGHYPRALMVVWIGAAAAWLFRAVFVSTDSDEVTGIAAWKRTVLIVFCIALGFLLFATIGFLVAAFFLIVVLAHLCGERGAAPWLLALTVPGVVYYFLLWVLEVRLPSLILG